MLDERYIVEKGDNLWRIAAKTLGGGNQWPRLWKFNNRREVVRITGRRIPNPDLIYVGQLLLIPRLPMERPAGDTADLKSADRYPSAGGESSTPSPMSQPKSSNASAPSAGASRGSGESLSSHTSNLRSPFAFKFRLPELPWPPIQTPTASIVFQMTGDILLMTKKAYPITFITSRGEVEFQLQNAANHAFGQLIADNRFVWDPESKRVTMRSMLVTQSNTPNAIASAVGVEVSSTSPIPKFRAEIRLPKLEGSITVFNYIAYDIKIVLEVTPQMLAPQRQSARPDGVPEPVTQVAPRVTGGGDNFWMKALGVGLLFVGTVVVVATLAEDYATFGLGAADDSVTVPGGLALMARGLSTLGLAGCTMPQAENPASVKVTNTLEVVGQK